MESLHPQGARESELKSNIQNRCVIEEGSRRKGRLPRQPVEYSDKKNRWKGLECVYWERKRVIRKSVIVKDDLKGQTEVLLTVETDLKVVSLSLSASDTRKSSIPSI